MEQLTLENALQNVEAQVLAEKRATAKRIDVNTVGKVYAGRPGCMCGCLGKYKVAPQHLVWANKDRGYAYSDEDGDISMRSVKLIVNKMNQYPELLEWADNGQYVYLDLDTRVYAAYFANF